MGLPLSHRSYLALIYRSIFISLLILSVAGLTSANAKAVVEYQYRVVNSYPHNPRLFTQGLEYHQGILFESAGQRGQSMVLKRTLDATKALQYQRLPDRFFAEGLTLLNNQLYQLTWQSQQGFIYSPDTLQTTGEFTIKGEGWGLTNNGHQLIISNGSNQLSFIDPKDFSVKRTLNVTFNDKPLRNLNELEWIDGLIYANVWQSDWIVMIDPNSGKVVAKLSLKHLLPAPLKTAKTDVLNGIAYDRENKRLLVTGKYWPLLFHIELFQTKQPQSK